ncbi:GNAT family N-acetyltransferase [Parendozoicomonas haliclonae]|uniref:Ribosomal-protein-L7/L12-serine acetyltransferase n=1 Tax=Parendozoicomonas haliclonae TaxID=1960125 RepID=A0A1X7AS86_9GAMM|nr:GNAT family protein [Parendozoicomonas haliclonae]SMA50940.1 ribosomal-protein-L7/L12-serine acetyltransferase [Parendozoicomonas haliclonae]
MSQEIGFPVADWHTPKFPPHEILEGHFCRLEPLNIKHVEDLHKSNHSSSYESLWTYLPYGPFKDVHEYETWIEGASKSIDPQFYAIIDTNKNLAVGVISYLRVSPESGSAEVGHLCFSSLLQKTPAATEAVYLMIKNVFDLGYRRCEWKCDALNANSMRSAKRLGFTFEGIFRQATIVKGRNRDTAWFSILDKEWPELDKGYRSWLSQSNFDSAGIQKSRLQDFFLPTASQ